VTFDWQQHAKWQRHANWHADGGDMHAAIGAREERLFDENQVMDWFAQARFACIDHAVHAKRAHVLRWSFRSASPGTVDADGDGA
jgi:hypothetical protein